MNHPCFDAQARHTAGRIHLPVAPRCNVQCNFCNRKYDCVNESRPGVTSSILTPEQALAYLDYAVAEVPNLTTMGIAGPGDPFANPDQTLATLRGTRERYPDMNLCVASNGLNVLPYVDDLVDVGLSHITITLNTLDPAVGAQIYAWVRYNKRVRAGLEAAQIMLENQLAAIEALKAHHMTVKVNCVVLPGINDEQIPALAQRVAEMGVDILNCIPFYPTQGTKFADLPAPSGRMINAIRKDAGEYLPQMTHCARCRADAVGLIGEAPSPAQLQRVADYAALKPGELSSAAAVKTALDRPYIAVATLEGMLINQHLGHADTLYIYAQTSQGIILREIRPTPDAGSGTARWRALSDLLHDCRALLVNAVGTTPRRVIEDSGVNVMVLEGVITDAVQAIYEGRSLAHLQKRPALACTGSGGGCGG